MSALKVYYEFEHGDNPVMVSTAEEVDALIDRVRADSVPAAPMQLSAFLESDPHAQILDVGISGDHGAIRYAGRAWLDGVFSIADAPSDGEPRFYYHMTHERKFPPNSDVPLSLVRQAIVEYLTSDGDRPSCVRWQAEGE